MITFATDPQTTERPTCLEARYQSLDGRWAVLEIWTHYGSRRRGDRILLVRVLAAGEYVVRRCKSRREAVRTAREIEQEAPVVVRRRRRRQRADN